MSNRPLVWLMALVLSACAGWRQPEVAAPVPPGAFFTGIPRGYELQAVLILRHRAGEERYLLALNTAAGQYRLALLTAQGIPLYTVLASAGGYEVSHQAKTAQRLTPEAALVYLLMAYGEEPALRRYVLARGYAMQTGAARRSFDPPGEATAPIRIDYRGAGPWFDAVEIDDPVNGLNILITVLEWRRVLPE